MGLDASKYAFVDIYGLDDELLAMVPQPVEAVLCLFPVTEEYEAKRLKEDAETTEFVGPEKDGELIWFKQTVSRERNEIAWDEDLWVRIEGIDSHSHLPVSDETPADRKCLRDDWALA